MNLLGVFSLLLHEQKQVRNVLFRNADFFNDHCDSLFTYTNSTFTQHAIDKQIMRVGY